MKKQQNTPWCWFLENYTLEQSEDKGTEIDISRFYALAVIHLKFLTC